MPNDHTTESCADCIKYQRRIRVLQDQLATLQAAVITDSLTELYNKRHFSESLNREMERTRRSLQATSLILLDIDHFKTINDQYGHVNGDRVLQSVAKTLKAAMRIIDIPCRYGGEEFALILPGTPLLTAIQVAQRLREALEISDIELSVDTRIRASASLGVSAYQAHHKMTGEQLVERADKQLYLAKQNGRNQVCAEIETVDLRTQLSNAEKDALLGNNEQ